MKRVLEGGGSVDKRLVSFLVGVLNPVSYKGLYKGCGGLVGFFLACGELGRMLDYSFPPCARTHTKSFLYARISPQWLSELR